MGLTSLNTLPQTQGESGGSGALCLIKLIRCCSLVYAFVKKPTICNSKGTLKSNMFLMTIRPSKEDINTNALCKLILY